jgi:hypothetical protein
MKNKKILIGSVLIIAVVALSLIMISSSESAGSDVTSNENTENMPTIDMLKNSDRTLNVDRIMSDGTYQIRFSDLVSLEALQTFKDKTVTAIGYLSPIASYDGSFGYLMNLPYQTCPYCLPSDTKITNTLAIFAKNGEQLQFTEAAVMVRGTLKLEPYTDEYGYSYNYRMVDVEIEKADTSDLGAKIVLYNQLAEKEVLTRLLGALYSVDDNVFYDEYTAQGYEYERLIVDVTEIDALLNDLNEFDSTEVSILINTANKIKEIATEVNKLIEAEEYSKISEYQESTEQLFYDINDWMSMYEL